MSYIGFGIVHSDQPFTIDEHTGDGTTTVFTLSTPKPVVSRAIIVTIDGVVQDPGALNSYDLDANGDLEFSEPPENLSSIRTLHLGRKYDLAVPMDGSVTPIKMAPDANGDFHFDTDTLYIDYLNDRVGINTSTPQHALDVVGDIHASGNITAGGNITLGDADTDTVIFNADITSHIIPDADATYDLGSATKHWNTVYTHEISFDPATVSTPTEGQLVWNADDGTLDLGMVNGNVVLQIGQETLIYGRNVSGATLTNGTVVKVVGASGDKITVDVADKTTEVTSATTIGVVTEDINDNSSGYITTQGLVRGLNTDLFNEGDAVYLGSSGAFTNVLPVSPDHLVLVGWVVRKHATEGMIYVYVRNGWEIEELHNVKITSLADQQQLRWNAGVGVWENFTQTLGTISDVDLTVAPTDGQSIIWDNANSKWIAGDSFNQSDFDSAIALKSIGVLSDVDITTNAPTANQSLIWDAVNGKFIPGDSFSQSDFDTAFTAKSTDDLSEGSTNLYYTDDRVNTFLASGAVTEFKSGLFKLENEFAVDDYVADDYTNTFVATIGSGALSADRTITVPDLSGSILLDSSSIGDLSDVNLSTPPTNEQVLVWDAATSKFIPGDAAADFTDLTGQISAGQIPNDIITNAMLNYTVNVFSQEFTADGINNTYTLTSDPGSKNALQIFVDGVPQRASNYTVVGTTLTLGGTPTNGQLVEVRGYGVVQPIGTVADNSITGAKLQDGTIDLSKIAPSDYYTADTFTGDGNTASYTLSTDPGSPYAITVYVAGVWQKPVTNYTVVGTTLTFTSNVANGEEVYVRYYGVALNVGTVADGSITGAKLQDGTIGTAKIEPGAYASQTFTGDNTTTVFTLNNDPGTAQALLVMVDNVIQEPAENYNTSGTTLTFTGPPALDSRIYVRYLGLPSGTANIPADDSVTNAKLNLSYTSNQYTGDGSTTDYTIPAGHNANSLLLILDGSILPPSDYSVSGTTLTFTSPPLLNQSIDIRYMPV